ncbi:MAG: hypothetical protein JXA57_17395 [Armatimonadetes bacterium]|nr:hypothetical protein [Armatimonadota bacterium]
MKTLVKSSHSGKSGRTKMLVGLLSVLVVLAAVALGGITVANGASAATTEPGPGVAEATAAATYEPTMEEATTEESTSGDGTPAPEQGEESTDQAVGPELALSRSWGAEPGEFGLRDSEEGIEGPLTFALRSNMEIYVLDQLNERVQVFFNGEVKDTFAVSGAGLIGLAVTADGYTVLNNFNEDRTALVYGPDGTFVEKLALPEDILVTRLLVRGTQVWARGLVESEAADGELSPYTKIWDNGKLAADRRAADRMPGTADNEGCRVQYDREGYLTFELERAGAAVATGRLPGSLDHLTCEWSQIVDGRLVVVAGTREGGELYWDAWTVHPAGEISGPMRLKGEAYSYLNKPVAISINGDIYIMSSSTQGVSIERHSCPR